MLLNNYRAKKIIPGTAIAKEYIWSPRLTFLWMNTKFAHFCLKSTKKRENDVCIFIEASPNARDENTAVFTPYTISEFLRK